MPRRLDPEVCEEVIRWIEHELERREALRLPRGLTPVQRAIVRSERIKRDRGPRSPYWERCRAFRSGLMHGMSTAEWWATWNAIQGDKRRRGW